MDEQTVEQMVESTRRLMEAAEALQQTLTQLSAQQQEISAKVEKIVAAVEEVTPHQLKENRYGAPSALPPSGAERAEHASGVPRARKTLSPLVTMILAKSGVEDGRDATVLDKALSGLTPEQRIAVKSEMARAGIIG
jgi:hypothetical protein